MSATVVQQASPHRPALAGKAALVVGPGRDAVAAAAALAGAGAAVALAAPDGSASLGATDASRTDGGRIMTIPTSLADPASLSRVAEVFGRLDVAVNSPGPVRRAAESAAPDCRAVYVAMSRELPALLRSTGGVIVNSALVPEGGRAEAAECVIGLTRATALDHAEHDIRINAVAYGPGSPEEFAAAVLWLSSPGAAHVNGAAVPVGLRAVAA
jgi:NAD(P)-dependent dehydrogenase (short-subunit alcohol dehydrogenase family)